MYIHTKAHVLPSVCADGCSFEVADVDAVDTLDTDGCSSEGANGGAVDTPDAVDGCLPAV